MFLNLRSPLLFLALVSIGLMHSGSETAAQQKPMVVSAEQLAKDYATDPKGFDKKYKDKVLIVEGVVQTPMAKDKDLTTGKETTWLILNGFKKAGDPVDTTVNFTGIADLKSVKKGDKVQVQGKCLEHSEKWYAARLEDAKLMKK